MNMKRRAKPNGGTGHALITGGAGFVATNVADRLLSAGQPVLLLDSLARRGVEQNLRWLQQRHGSLVRFCRADVRDERAVAEAVRGAREVYHFAAQVAVTTSLVDPVDDFEINARGTLNLLEAVRAQASPPSVLFTSTKKVYGDLADVPLRQTETRYEPENAAIRKLGLAEDRPLDFHSPYGCSKGAAEQYVLDYSRTFGLHTVVFRMSCIYGPHQFGTEDQGWVAHFLIQALEGRPITIFGDGRQVRDVLFVEDLVDAMLLAHRHADRLRGTAFNIGGGPANTISLLELLALIRRLTGEDPVVRLEPWRAADQRYYVSNPARFGALTGWRPSVPAALGVRRLLEWLARERVARRPIERTAPMAVPTSA